MPSPAEARAELERRKREEEKREEELRKARERLQAMEQANRVIAEAAAERLAKIDEPVGIETELDIPIPGVGSFDPSVVPSVAIGAAEKLATGVPDVARSMAGVPLRAQELASQAAEAVGVPPALSWATPVHLMTGGPAPALAQAAAEKASEVIPKLIPGQAYRGVGEEFQSLAQSGAQMAPLLAASPYAPAALGRAGMPAFQGALSSALEIGRQQAFGEEVNLGQAAGIGAVTGLGAGVGQALDVAHPLIRLAASGASGGLLETGRQMLLEGRSLAELDPVQITHAAIQDAALGYIAAGKYEANTAAKRKVLSTLDDGLEAVGVSVEDRASALARVQSAAGKYEKAFAPDDAVVRMADEAAAAQHDADTTIMMRRAAEDPALIQDLLDTAVATGDDGIARDLSTIRSNPDAVRGLGEKRRSQLRKWVEDRARFEAKELDRAQQEAEAQRAAEEEQQLIQRQQEEIRRQDPNVRLEEEVAGLEEARRAQEAAEDSGVAEQAAERLRVSHEAMVAEESEPYVLRPDDAGAGGEPPREPPEDLPPEFIPYEELPAEGAYLEPSQAVRGIKSGYLYRARDAWYKPLIDRIAAYSGKIGGHFHVKAVHAVDAANIYYGRFSEKSNNVRRQTGMPRQHVRELSRVVERRWEGTNDGYGNTRAKLAIENDTAYNNLEYDASRSSVDAVRELIAETGKEAQRLGLTIRVKRSTAMRRMRMLDAGAIPEAFPGEAGQLRERLNKSRAKKLDIPFIANVAGKRYLRFLTPAGREVIEGGVAAAEARARGERADPLAERAFDVLTRAIAEMSHMDQGNVYSDLHAAFERGVELKSNVEVARLLPDVPTHIIVDGKTIPILETNLANMAERTARGFAQRFGFASEFGQRGGQVAEALWGEKGKELAKRYDLDGLDSAAAIVKIMRSGEKRTTLSKEAGQVAEDLVRALQGAPVEDPRMVPGSSAETSARYAKSGMSAMRTLGLTASVAPNVAEFMAKVVPLFGLDRTLKGAAKAVASKEFRTLLARQGAVTQEVWNWTIDPGRAPESIADAFRNIALNVTGAIPMNEANEVFAAAAGYVFARDLAAGKGTLGDGQALAIMRFTDAEVRVILGGREAALQSGMTKKQWSRLMNAVTTRAAEITMGSTSWGAQRSRLAHSALYNVFFAYQSYAQMTFDRMGKAVSNVSEASKRYGRNSPEAKAASAMLWRLATGHAASGVAANVIRAFMFGGTMGVGSYWREATEGAREGDYARAGANILGAALDGAQSAMFAGMSEGAISMAKAGPGRFGESIDRMSHPISAARETWQALSGSGYRYEGLNLLERGVQYLQAVTPGSRVAMTWLGTLGIGENPELNQAFMTWYRWRRRHLGSTKATSHGPGYLSIFRGDIKQQERFRWYMSRAAKMLRKVMAAEESGESSEKWMSEVTAALDEAFEIKQGLSPDDADVAVRNSILGRRVFHGASGVSGDDIFDAFAADHPEAARMLESYDAFLEGWADTLRPWEGAKRRGRGRGRR